LSTGAIGILGKTPRQQGAGVLFSNFRFIRRESKNLREETPLIFRGRWDGAQIMLGYSHHEGVRMA
jgi:hypothetical protein